MSTNERDENIQKAAEKYSTHNPNEKLFGLNLQALDQCSGFKAGARWAFEQSDARVERPEDQLSKIKGECAVAIMESVELKARVKMLREALEITNKYLSKGPFYDYNNIVPLVLAADDKLAKALESDELAEKGSK